MFLQMKTFLVENDLGKDFILWFDKVDIIG